MGAHKLKESAREAGVQNHGVKLVVKHKDFTMETWDNQRCKTTYGSTAPAGITDSMLCAGKKGKDSCSGDCGGPFVTPEGDHWTQIGVVSWGIGCGKQHYPGVYTRVSKMMEWINKVRRLYPGKE